ncbi:MAG: GDP-L-fucose synthase [Pacificimonas sp.]|nr:GDP-L-fucose synthase [Pacificimonas sp.]
MTPYDLTGQRVFVAGHRGMVGSAICRRLRTAGCETLTAPRDDVDLVRQHDVEQWFDRNRPDAVFLSAARVGGIHANATYPADFLYDNLMIEANIIRAAAQYGTRKLLFLGSSCIYPKHAEQPIRENSLLTGPLEPTNEWYAIAKIAGVKLCEAFRHQHGCDFISAMPTNLYGTGDNYHPLNSHVLPALIRRFDEAVQGGAPAVTIWGTGTPLREFMHADDVADALVFLMENYSGPEPVNVGSGQEVSIRELAGLVAQSTGFTGEIDLDPSKPDGTPRKLMDSSRLTAMGWTPRIALAEGIDRTVAEYRAQAA